MQVSPLLWRCFWSICRKWPSNTTTSSSWVWLFNSVSLVEIWLSLISKVSLNEDKVCSFCFIWELAFSNFWLKSFNSFFVLFSSLFCALRFLWAVFNVWPLLFNLFSFVYNQFVRYFFIGLNGKIKKGRPCFSLTMIFVFVFSLSTG